MDARDVMTARALQPASTSYWSTPEKTLDPFLFSGTRVKATVRAALLRLLYDFWHQQYRYPERWSDVWIAGSGASYQWAAARDPGDLDILIGVDYPAFREANPGYTGLSDEEISENFNDEFRAGLDNDTAMWNGYEVTWYVNPHATDIRTIHPYAAYCLTHDNWTVRPDPHVAPPSKPLFDQGAAKDTARAQEILDRYNEAHGMLAAAGTDPGRTLNAATALKRTLNDGAALFDEIHQGRRNAFDPAGEGYGDWANYRWQAGKRSGAIPALRDLKAERGSLYGEAPVAADKLLIQAALYRRSG